MKPPTNLTRQEYNVTKSTLVYFKVFIVEENVQISSMDNTKAFIVFSVAPNPNSINVPSHHKPSYLIQAP